jgi:hypothetical protein
MEAILSSQISALIRATRRDTPEDSILHFNKGNYFLNIFLYILFLEIFHTKSIFRYKKFFTQTNRASQ